MARRFGEREIEPVKKRTGLLGKKMLIFMAIYLVVWVGSNVLFPKEWDLNADAETLFSAQAQEQVSRKINADLPLYIQGFTFELGDGKGFREQMSFGAVPYEARGENTYRAWYISYDAALKKPYQLHRINQEFKMSTPPSYSMEGAYQAMERISGQLRALYDAIPAQLREGASAIFLSTASASAYPNGDRDPAAVSPQAVTITLSDTLSVTQGVQLYNWNEKTLAFIYCRYPEPIKEGAKSPQERTELVGVVELPQG